MDGAAKNYFKEDIGVQAEYYLFIFIQGYIAEDPDDELIPIGDKCCRLPEVFFRSLKKAPHGC